MTQQDGEEETIDASQINAEFYNIYAKALIHLGDAEMEETKKAQYYKEAKGRIQNAFDTFARNTSSDENNAKSDKKEGSIIHEALLDDKQKETLIDTNLTFAKATTREVSSSVIPRRLKQ
jgi:hypothetical protein